MVSNLPSGLANIHFFQLCSTIMISEFSPMYSCLFWMRFTCKHTWNSLQSYPRTCSFQICSLQTFLPADLNLDLTPETLSKQKLNCSSLSQQHSVTDNTVTATATKMENQLKSKQIWLKQFVYKYQGNLCRKLRISACIVMMGVGAKSFNAKGLLFIISSYLCSALHVFGISSGLPNLHECILCQYW